MKGVADRTLELMNELQKEQYIKSYRHFQHFLVVKIDGLEDTVDNLTDQLHRVARERDKERELKMQADDALFDKYMEVKHERV